MVKRENAGQAQSAESTAKRNRGQDEITHTLTAPDGTTVEATQREWRDTYRSQGYTRAEDDPDDATPDDAESD